MNTTVRRTNQYDRLGVSVKFATGGVFRFSITRSGDNLILGGSSDPKVAKEQQAIVAAWISPLKDESHGARIDRVTQLAGNCKSVAELCDKIRNALPA